MLQRGDGRLPDKILCGDFRTEVAKRAFGPMSQCVGLNHARANAPANWGGFSIKRREIFFVSCMETQGEVSVTSGEHGRSLPFRGIEGVGNNIGCVLGDPLVRAPAGLFVSCHS
jgi:hypothetical protein